MALQTEKSQFDVLIVGCGVSGLTSGIRLLQHGFNVTIIAREQPPHTTSDVAAAVWYPYQAEPIDRVLGWGKASLDEFKRLMGEPNAGVRLGWLTEVFDQHQPDPLWKDIVPNFERVSPDRLPPGYQDGYSVKVPLIETPKYMKYLMDQFELLKGRIETGFVSKLSDLYQDGRLLINCTGVWARQLAGDEDVYPLRGQIVRVKASGVEGCIVDESGHLALTYIIPRSEDCVLGGTAEKNDWNLQPNPETTKQILDKCKELVPSLVIEEILQVSVGLRPRRNKAVRVEREVVSDKCIVIHNYGHGGAGFTLSWGCADEVARLAMIS